MAHRVRTGQIYRVQVDFNNLNGAYVRVVQVFGTTAKEEPTAFVLKSSGEKPEFMRIPLWVLEQSLLVSPELLSELRFKAWFRRLSWWQKIFFCIRCITTRHALDDIDMKKLSSSFFS